MDSKAWIDQVFDNLDRWRHLPAYQLERRADIFFSLYLCDILESEFHRKPKHIIPEFPIRKATSNLSNKMDYLAVMDAPPGLVFVELKTDPASMGLPQLRYLLDAQDAQGKSNSALFDGLKSICKASKAAKKYDGLIRELIEARLVDHAVGRSFELSKDFPDPLKAMILYIHPCSERPLFLQRADPTRAKVIDVPFREVVKIVKRHRDDLSIRFLQSLQSWATEVADNKRCKKDNGRMPR